MAYRIFPAVFLDFLSVSPAMLSIKTPKVSTHVPVVTGNHDLFFDLKAPGAG